MGQEWCNSIKGVDENVQVEAARSIQSIFIAFTLIQIVIRM
jgi:hypothetical protein